MGTQSRCKEPGKAHIMCRNARVAFGIWRLCVMLRLLSGPWRFAQGVGTRPLLERQAEAESGFVLHGPGRKKSRRCFRLLGDRGSMNIHKNTRPSPRNRQASKMHAAPKSNGELFSLAQCVNQAMIFYTQACRPACLVWAILLLPCCMRKKKPMLFRLEPERHGRHA